MFEFFGNFANLFVGNHVSLSFAIKAKWRLDNQVSLMASAESSRCVFTMKGLSSAVAWSPFITLRVVETIRNDKFAYNSVVILFRNYCIGCLALLMSVDELLNPLIAMVGGLGILGKRKPRSCSEAEGSDEGSR